MLRALCVLLLAASALGYRVSPNFFILNGEDADEGEWPHQVRRFLNTYG